MKSEKMKTKLTLLLIFAISITVKSQSFVGAGVGFSPLYTVVGVNVRDIGVRPYLHYTKQVANIGFTTFGVNGGVEYCRFNFQSYDPVIGPSEYTHDARFLDLTVGIPVKHFIRGFDVGIMPYYRLNLLTESSVSGASVNWDNAFSYVDRFKQHINFRLEVGYRKNRVRFALFTDYRKIITGFDDRIQYAYGNSGINLSYLFHKPMGTPLPRSI